MNLRKLLPCLAAIAVALCAAGGVRAAAIVNGDFGTGNLTGWSASSWGGPGGVGVVTSPAPPDGTYCASLWAGPNGTSQLVTGNTQGFYAHVGDVLSFEYQGTYTAGESGLSAKVIGSGGYGGGYLLYPPGNSVQALSSQWQSASFQFGASGIYYLDFEVQEAALGQIDFYVADVQLTPEPASMGLLAAGLGALLIRRRIG